MIYLQLISIDFKLQLDLKVLDVETKSLLLRILVVARFSQEGRKRPRTNTVRI